MSGKELTLTDLLVAEDDPAVLDFRCAETGLLIWPQIRTAFLRMIISDMLYSSPLMDVPTLPRPSGQALATMSRSIFRNAWFFAIGRARADVCFFTSGVGNQPVDGKFLNRLTDQLMAFTPARTVAIEEDFEWRWPFPRHNSRVIMQAPLQAYLSVVGRLNLRTAHREQARRLIDLVSARSRLYFDWSPNALRHRHLVEMLAQKIAAMPVAFRAYQTLLRRIRPKLALVNTACYGPYSILIAAARQLGIFTAEFQHGAISAGHDGYFFAPTLANSPEYRKMLPDYFLGFGSWWNNQINAPLEKIVIGNPHRDLKLALHPPAGLSRNKFIILSDGYDFDKCVDLARELEPYTSRKGLQLTLRPHPLERTKLEARYKDKAPPFEIDRIPDIYTSFQSAAAVLGEGSTGIFDAIGVVERQFVWNTRKARFYYPEHPCVRFESADQLCAMLDQPAAGTLTPDKIESIWASNWKRSFLDFLARVGL